MRVWIKPELEALDVNQTMQGVNFKKDNDEIRVDQYGQFWIGGASGPASFPDGYKPPIILP